MGSTVGQSYMRKEPVTMKNTRFVGLDVHAATIAEAGGEVRSLGTRRGARRGALPVPEGIAPPSSLPRSQLTTCRGLRRPAGARLRGDGLPSLRQREAAPVHGPTVQRDLDLPLSGEGILCDEGARDRELGEDEGLSRRPLTRRGHRQLTSLELHRRRFELGPRGREGYGERLIDTSIRCQESQLLEVCARYSAPHDAHVESPQLREEELRILRPAGRLPGLAEEDLFHKRRIPAGAGRSRPARWRRTGPPASQRHLVSGSGRARGRLVPDVPGERDQVRGAW